MEFRRAPPTLFILVRLFLFKDNSLIANRVIAIMNAPESCKTWFSSWTPKKHETAISFIQVNFHRCD